MNKQYVNIKKNFGKKIKIERIKKEISQEQLAEFSNLHKNTISSIENGWISPTLDTIYRLAKALDLTLPEIVDLNF
ncbi:helix-turn-helix transcriptional regulator [bacterium]|nr:helix-turn-helix transcriptional regulator [bacterium]